ncbi:hypothetical protein BDR07DRAFT_1479389 [Suillus spraguei]|nr:hypothetical protein BDR07DRAFT_1479389 [Suillus spraguei]
MDYFNKEVFDITSQSLLLASHDFPSATQAQTWEDDLLDALDAPAQMPSTLTSLPDSSVVVNVISSYHTSISVNNAQSTSATAQLQLGVSQLTLSSGAIIEPTASATHSVLAHQPQHHTTASELAYAPEPKPVGCVTRHGGREKGGESAD